jgi:hypothetical protein
MKHTTLLAALVAVFGTSSVFADGVISDVMKKYHKAPDGQDPLTKKIGNGEGTASEINELLKAYEAMAKEKPEKGLASSWDQKNAALITAVKKLQKDPKDTSDFKKAVNCKACHEPHK